MAKPIVIQILDAIETRLAAITTTGGYSRNVASVYRPEMVNLDNYTPTDSTIVLILGQRTRNDEDDVGHLRWTQIVHVMPCCIPTEWVGSDIDTVCQTFAADVEASLMSDPQFSGLAADAIIKTVSPLQTNDNYAGVDIELHVDYSTLRANPTAL